MRFWDASALVPLFLAEPTTLAIRRARQEDLDIYAWWDSRVECASVVARLVREGQLDEVAAMRARQDLNGLYEEVSEVAPTKEVRARADLCLAAHPLRAADALQLGAALVWAAEVPQGKEFVSLDVRLREAAGKEGFTVLPDRR